MADAQLSLGTCYENGKGVETNEVEAVKWYRKAAEHGNDLAKYFLGMCYKHGVGVAQSAAEAEVWFDKIKSPMVLCQIGDGFIHSDTSEAAKWFRKAAEHEGKSGDDTKRIEKIFVGYAQYKLGLSYLLGKGVPQNTGEGVKWLKEAARNGYEKAQETLDKIPKLEGVK